MADDLLRETGRSAEAGPTREIGKEWPAGLMLAALWGFSLWAKGRFPARVPIHWDLAGQVNGWASPLLASTGLIPTLVLLPVLGAVIHAYWIRHRLQGGGIHMPEVP